MKAITSILLLATLASCDRATAPQTDLSLDLLGDVVRSVRLAEVEIQIWNDEVLPLRSNLAGVLGVKELYAESRPTMDDVQAIRQRAELLISSIPRRAPEEVLASLTAELGRADAAVSAYRGPRNRLLALAQN